MSAELLKEYDATLDTKRRFVVRGLPPFNHYHVRVYTNDKGAFTLKMEPQVLAKLNQLSANTLRMMDKSMKNLAKGVVGKPVNLDELKRFADAGE
ncbi:MAG: hypothetical protein JW699_03315 [Chitinispirillaceae bacterium]|nr:hypothetical protein [Chitinispirillaceae bacterium]